MIHYGDNLRWFVADVIDASPPYGYEGRVRVRIHGVHNPSTRQVKQNDLPWAQVVLPTTEGGVSGLGSTPRLEAGALVFGMFMDGKESQVPIVLGSLPRTEFPTAVQQSLAFQDLLERVDPDIDFYNQSLAAIDIDDAAIADTEEKASDSTVRHSTALRFFLSNNYSSSKHLQLLDLFVQSTMTSVQKSLRMVLVYSNGRMSDLIVSRHSVVSGNDSRLSCRSFYTN